MEKQDNYSNEEELCLKLSRGNEEAYSYIFEQYKADVLKLAKRFAKTPQHADDLTLGVFAKVWVNRRELTEIPSLTEYIFITAHDYMLSETKKEGENE